MSWIVTPLTTEWPDLTQSGMKLIVVDEPGDVPFPMRGCGHNWPDRDRVALLNLDRAVEYSRQPGNWRNGLGHHPIFASAADAINGGLMVRGEFGIIDQEGSMPSGVAWLLAKPLVVGYQTPTTILLYWRLHWRDGDDLKTRIVRIGREGGIIAAVEALRVNVESIRIRNRIL